MSTIDKKEIEHLARLAYLKLTPEEIEKYTRDLAAIVDYFKELQNVPTDTIEPMAGGTFQRNRFRDEGAYPRDAYRAERDKIVEAFPEKENDALVVPPVFAERNNE